jgi:cellobiose-specific phosphotransferase system component IIC
MMKQLVGRMDNRMKKAEQLPGIRSIRGGLVPIIPILMIGSIALIFKSLPIDAWQNFLATGTGVFVPAAKATAALKNYTT